MAAAHDARSVAELIDALSGAHSIKYVYFWGHTPQTPDSVDRSCLSQWFPAPFEFEGKQYATAEHYMMAGKARLFGDEAAELRVLAAETPGEAKAIGREVRGFDSGLWDRHRFSIVVDANVGKFSAHAALRDYLVGTGQRVLVEASPVDRIWGVGLAADRAREVTPDKWRGLNLLGFALMEARARLLAER